MSSEFPRFKAKDKTRITTTLQTLINASGGVVEVQGPTPEYAKEVIIHFTNSTWTTPDQQWVSTSHDLIMSYLCAFPDEKIFYSLHEAPATMPVHPSPTVASPATSSSASSASVASSSAAASGPTAPDKEWVMTIRVPRKSLSCLAFAIPFQLEGRDFSKPSTRIGDRKGTMEFGVWLPRLRQVHDTSHFEQTPKDTTVLLDTISLQQMPPERPNTEYKYPASSTTLPIHTIPAYLSEVLLNVQEFPISLILGVDDHTRMPIGVEADPKTFINDFRAALETTPIFPKLKASDFQIIFRKVPAPDSFKTWPYLKLEPKLARLCVALSSGRAQVCPLKDLCHKVLIDSETEKLIADFHPDKHLHYAKAFSESVAKIVPKLKNMNFMPQLQEKLLVPVDRWVIEIKKQQSSGAYFRTSAVAPTTSFKNDVNKLRLYCPLGDDKVNNNMDACSIWLRSRIPVKFPLAIIQILQSSLVPKMLIPSSQAVMDSIRHYSGLRRLENVVSVKSSVSDFLPLVVILDYHNLPLPNLHIHLVPMILLIIFVDPTEANCWEQLETALIPIFKSKKMEILDIRSYSGTPACLPFRSESRDYYEKSSPLKNLPSPSDLGQEMMHPPNLSNKGECWDLAALKSKYREFTQRFLNGDRSPPPWELFVHKFFALRTKTIDNINDFVRTWLSSETRLEILTLAKVHPVSGATWALRRVAMDQCEYIPVLWINSVSHLHTCDDIASEVSSRLQRSARAIIFTDELPMLDADRLKVSLTMVADHMKVLWIRVHSGHQLPSMKECVLLDGIVEKEDVYGVWNSLAFLKDLNFTDSVISMNILDDPPFTRSMMALHIKATGKVGESIKHWLKSIDEKISASLDLTDLALSLASIFFWSSDLSPNFSVYASIQKFESHPSFSDFLCLFRSPRRSHFGWIPPLLAESFLCVHFKSDTLSLENLMAIWKATCKALKPDLVKTFALQPPNDTLSPFFLRIFSEARLKEGIASFDSIQKLFLDGDRNVAFQIYSQLRQAMPNCQDSTSFAEDFENMMGRALIAQQEEALKLSAEE